jgi:hypothetical protein
MASDSWHDAAICHGGATSGTPFFPRFQTPVTQTRRDAPRATAKHGAIQD